ncbi:MAG: cell division protein ZapE [Hyphomicrobiales bacterium]
MHAIRKAYETLVASGELTSDAKQLRVISHLDKLADEMSRYTPRTHTKGWKRWFKADDVAEMPQGLYLIGDVGRGKTMLMDLFYANVDFAPKKRIHFHAFMQNVHTRVHHWRKQHNDPIPPVARELADDAKLLCFDEFQVSDITDAMILGRLFSALFEHGVVVVTTSNVHPENLYEHGLNRNSFVPFIKLVQERLEVVSLESPIDYRLNRLMGRRVYVTPLGDEADRVLQTRWEHLTECERGETLDLELKGRTLHVPQAARGVARFSFADLCEKPLGPPDFLKIAETFDTVFVENIPKLDKSRRNEAKRFVILIDALYDNHVRLIASAETPPEEIYPNGDHAFEFSRTASRLNEMQSEDYLMHHG